MQTHTVLAILLAPLGFWLMSLPGRWVARFLWRKLPDGRIKKALFGDVRFMDYPPGVKPWDQ